MNVVLDSNLVIAVLNADDAHNVDATNLLHYLNAGGYTLLAPALYLWELHAYQHHPDHAKKHVQSNVIPNFAIEVIDVTSGLFTRTFSDAMTFIKGADRVFVSLAKDHNAPLITNDNQVLAHAADLGVKAISAKDFLAGGGP